MIEQIFIFNNTTSLSNPIFDISEVAVGQHLYWQIGDYQVHGQVLITSWIILGSVIIFTLLANSDLKPLPVGLQNFTELVTEFIRDLAKTQIGEEEYLRWASSLSSGTRRVLIRQRPNAAIA